MRHHHDGLGHVDGYRQLQINLAIIRQVVGKQDLIAFSRRISLRHAKTIRCLHINAVAELAVLELHIQGAFRQAEIQQRAAGIRRRNHLLGGIAEYEQFHHLHVGRIGEIEEHMQAVAAQQGEIGTDIKNRDRQLSRLPGEDVAAVERIGIVVHFIHRDGHHEDAVFVDFDVVEFIAAVRRNRHGQRRGLLHAVKSAQVGFQPGGQLSAGTIDDCAFDRSRNCNRQPCPVRCRRCASFGHGSGFSGRLRCGRFVRPGRSRLGGGCGRRAGQLAWRCEGQRAHVGGQRQALLVAERIPIGRHRTGAGGDHLEQFFFRELRQAFLHRPIRHGQVGRLGAVTQSLFAVAALALLCENLPGQIKLRLGDVQ